MSSGNKSFDCVSVVLKKRLTPIYFSFRARITYGCAWMLCSNEWTESHFRKLGILVKKTDLRLDFSEGKLGER